MNADGHREILGLQVTTAEDGAGWLAFFRDLVARGLTGVAAGHLRRPHRAGRGDRRDAARRGLAALIRQHRRWREVPAGPPPPPGEDLGSVTLEVQRQTRPSRRWPSSIGQWESCLEHLDERPEGSATRRTLIAKGLSMDRTDGIEDVAGVRRDRLGRQPPPVVHPRHHRQAADPAAGHPRRRWPGRAGHRARPPRRGVADRGGTLRRAAGRAPAGPRACGVPGVAADRRPSPGALPGRRGQGRPVRRVRPGRHPAPRTPALAGAGDPVAAAGRDQGADPRPGPAAGDPAGHRSRSCG